MFLQELVTKINNTINCEQDIIPYFRYVDDIFIVYNEYDDSKPDTIIDSLNQLQNNMEFTKEGKKKKNKEKSITWTSLFL